MSSGPVTSIRRVKRVRATHPDQLIRINAQNQLVDALGNVIGQPDDEGNTSEGAVEEGGDWNPSDDDMSDDEDKPEVIESVSENEDDEELVEEDDDEEEEIVEEEEESDEDDEEDSLAEDDDAMDVDQ